MPLSVQKLVTWTMRLRNVASGLGEALHSSGRRHRNFKSSYQAGQESFAAATSDTPTTCTPGLTSATNEHNDWQQWCVSNKTTTAQACNLRAKNVATGGYRNHIYM